MGQIKYTEKKMAIKQKNQMCLSGRNKDARRVSGPDHPWLIETYIAAAPHPHSSVIGQEIFQSGVVPSDTDFRIFRDYGKIPGEEVFVWQAEPWCLGPRGGGTFRGKRRGAWWLNW